jgi:GntR family transcriptional repressor for pyruvate dehydrogenase complex
MSSNSTSLPLRAVQREPTLASQVTLQLEDLISTQHLQPGDRLPSERELAKLFGVSRTVIREAMRAMAAKGLVEVQSGSGTILSTLTAETVSKSFSMLLRQGRPHIDYDKVNEVRRLLEIEIAGLAALRRTQSDLDKLQAIVVDMNAMKHDRASFARLDVAFHTALAEATYNELFVIMLESLSDVMLEVRLIGFDVPDAPQNAIDYHHRIYEQVRDGNSQASRDVMAEHLHHSEQIFREGLARQGR